MAEMNTVTVKIAADTTEFGKSIDKARDAVDQLSRAIEKLRCQVRDTMSELAEAIEKVKA